MGNGPHAGQLRRRCGGSEIRANVGGSGGIPPTFHAFSDARDPCTPQVAMLQAWWVGAIEVVIIAVGTFAYASTVPVGASFWRRAFAGLAMSAFLVMVGNAAAAFALLLFVGSMFASSL